MVGSLQAHGPVYTLIPPQSELGAPQTFRLDLNSMKTDVGKPLVKMSAYWDEVGTCRTRTSPRATRSLTKCKSISTCLVR